MKLQRVKFTGPGFSNAREEKKGKEKRTARAEGACMGE